MFRRGIVAATASGIARTAGHACTGSVGTAVCKHCIAVNALRVSTLTRATFASSARSPAKKENATQTHYPLSRLHQSLEKELVHQQELIKKEKLTPPQVESKHADLIKRHNIAIELLPDDVTQARLVWTNAAEGLRYVLQFDMTQVAESANYDQHNEVLDQEDDEAQEEDEDNYENEDYEDEDSYEDSEDVLPFDVNVKIYRDAIPGRYLNIDCEVSPDFAKPGSMKLNVNYLTVESTATDANGKAEDIQKGYLGPNFNSLDSSITERLSNFVNTNFASLMPLVAAYSQAHEAGLYAKWLHQMKEFVPSSK